MSKKNKTIGKLYIEKPSKNGYYLIYADIDGKKTFVGASEDLESTKKILRVLHDGKYPLRENLTAV
jgi:hypothetical protein